MKNALKLFGIIAMAVLFVFAFTACDDGSGGDSESPYTEHRIWYLGYKSGLYSWSSEQKFVDAFIEVSQKYNTDNPSDNVGVHNNVTYEAIDWQDITGSEPKIVFDAFWEDLYEYDYSIGSCWRSNFVTLPSIGAAGTVYVINAIVSNTQSGGYIFYWASKATLRPIESRNVLGLNSADETSYFFHGENLRQKSNQQKLNSNSKGDRRLD